MGVAPGRTTVIATTDAGLAIVQYDVTVTPGVTGAALPGAAPVVAAEGVSTTTARAIQASIARTVQGASAVQVRAAGNDVILTGTVPNATAAQQSEAIARGYIGEKGGVIVNLTVLGAIQVNVRVRIAEIDRSITRQLGINWQALGTIGSIGRLPATTLNLPGTVAGTTSALATAACASSMLGGSVGVPLSVQCQGINFNGIIDALAQDQLATVLAEPNLTVLSGDTASFLAGGEFPVPVAGNGNNGSTTITVEYKAFGVSLVMVPTVLSPTRLNLRVRPEVSQLSTNGAISIPIGSGTLTIPALTVRRAETTIELGSGQSFAIAGLLQKTSVNADNALPGLGELPVLGALFKSNSFQRGESEVVIIVTPYIVQPVSNPSTLRTPVDGFRPATDLDRILFGRQLGPPMGGGAPVDAGFILK
jgi:pilus assembly protein CpaC